MTDTAELFIDCRCELGEGPLWHPGIGRLFWFDILNQTLFGADADGRMIDRFIFKNVASAAAIIDDDNLAVATADGIYKHDIVADTNTLLVPLEPDLPGNRPNDGRANFAGGFWIGTMSRKGGQGPNQGSVYQFRGGQLEKLFGDVTIPNSTCFSADGRTAYFSDTLSQQIKKCAIDPETGVPIGPWEPFASTEGHRGDPDGSVIDAEGYLWNARFNGSCVVRHAPDGSIDRVIEVPVPRVTCPAFGGDDLRTLYITTARENASPAELEQYPTAGSIFAIRVDVPGLPEPTIRIK
jgi:sugar lactone lactonase YvrE